MSPILWCFSTYFRPASALSRGSWPFAGVMAPLDALPAIALGRRSPSGEVGLATAGQLSTLNAKVNFATRREQHNSPRAHQIQHCAVRKSNEKTCPWTLINIQSLKNLALRRLKLRITLTFRPFHLRLLRVRRGIKS